MDVISGYRDGETVVDGNRLHFLEWGQADAPPFVLLHGLTGHAHIWDHMAPQLAQRYRLLVPDQRGHGASAHTATYTTDDFVRDVEGLRSAWGIERFALMGLSMGGHNAFAYAHAYPHRVSHLIAIDIPPRLDPRTWPDRAALEEQARRGHALFGSLDEAVEASRAGNPTAPEANLRYRTKWNLRDAEGSLQLVWDPKVQVTWEPRDLTDALREIRIPTLLVRGGRTNVLPRRVAEEMATALPDGELVEIPTSGHSVPTDRPEELAPLVLEWLERRR